LQAAKKDYLRLSVTLPQPFQNALILTGPTASGKTALALELAPLLNAEIIAMDSMTLYRGMDIGTAKPSLAERSAVPHHLIDVLDPWESGNVAWWLKEAGRCCQEIESRGKQVLFVGGTPFFLKALMQGLFDSPPADHEMRRQLESEAETIGAEALHAKLAAVDPASAKRLHPNDVRRVVRALEVWHLTGKPLSDWQQQGWFAPKEPPHPDPLPRSGGEGGNPSFSLSPASGERVGVRGFFEHCLAIDILRDELYARINQRVEAMFAAGWIDEVQRLRQLPQPLSKEAAQALGYREIGDFLDGKRSLPETVAEIQLRSRQFAKRQLTWFRNLPGCLVVEGKLTFDLWRGKMS
jgi:tRNA dimethylallyltransferase